MTRPNIIQLSEFDVTQRIVESLSNICTRAVLFSIIDTAKDASQIAKELRISLSTVYKTLTHLADLALVDIDKFDLNSDGKKIKLYKSRVGKVEILFHNTEPILNLYPNESKSSTDV